MKKSCFLFVVFFVCFTSPLFTDAQCTTSTGSKPPALPLMYVDKPTGDLYIKEFSKYRLFRGSKYQQLNKLSKVQIGGASVIYTYAALEKVLSSIKSNGVVVHFARVTTTKGTRFEALDSNIVLLFSQDGETPKEYYLIKNNDNEPVTIEAGDGIRWIEDFKNFNHRYLKRTLMKKDLDNYPGWVRNKSNFTDTRGLIYSKENMIQAFVTERQYQNEIHHVNLDAFKVMLS